MKRLLACGLLAVLAACSDAVTAPSTHPIAPPALASFARHASRPIAGRYIVVFKSTVKDVGTEASAIEKRHRAKIRHVFKTALRGVTLDVADSEVAALRAEPTVAYVEQDQTVSVNTRLDSPLANAASGQCLTTQNESAAAETPATVAACSGTDAQLLNLPAVGTTGQVLFFSGSTCLDDFYAGGAVGDVVGIYFCHGGTNQDWVLTSAGELRGINSLCVDASGSSVTLQSCDGSESQRWTAGTQASPTPPAQSTTQTDAGWGLDRVDQRMLPLNGSYTFQADGSGITAYIIDTGINFTHVDFGGRAAPGIDVITAGGGAADCNGHGTHVAGTVGGAAYGIAKNVHLVGVRVLDCGGSGSTSGVIAGIDWVTANRVLPAVANMSLGGGFSQALNDAVERSIAAGVVFAVAAGNSAADACTASPASAPNAITVGATDDTDAFASFSNYGGCVKLNAPGVAIISAWIGSNTISTGASGTSMASPHVAGAAAVYLQRNPAATPDQVRAALISDATPSVLRGISGDTPNLLLYSPSGG